MDGISANFSMCRDARERPPVGFGAKGAVRAGFRVCPDPAGRPGERAVEPRRELPKSMLCLFRRCLAKCFAATILDACSSAVQARGPGTLAWIAPTFTGSWAAAVPIPI